MVYDWLDRNTDSNGLPQPKAVSKRTPPLTRISTEWKNAEALMDSLPKMESHYCRASTSKIYLEPEFVSIADLMRVYEKHCRDNRYNFIGRMSLNRIFDQKNLSLFKPKKAQCDICVGHSHGSVSDENYNIHITRKNEARMYKDNEKQRASDEVKVNTIRPGIKVGDPVVTDIRSLKYKPEGVIQYKVSYADEYKDLTKRRNATVPTGREVIPPLYTGPLQIKKS